MKERLGKMASCLADDEHEALRQLIDTTPALIHTGRADGYLDYFNRGWLTYIGATLDDVCGWRWKDFIHPDDVDELVSKWRAALDSGEPLVAESRVRRADGEYRANHYIVEALWARRQVTKPVLSHTLRLKPEDTAILQ